MKIKTSIWIVLAACLGAAAPVLAFEVRGDYLEARTSDVYTGPCFANSEVNLAGKEAILAWRVRQGGFGGVALDGLSVVAVVRARATLGDPFASPFPIRSVIVVDERATAPQREALVAFARRMAGDLLQAGFTVEAAPIHAEFAGRGVASVLVQDLAEVRTRALCSHDHICGNEEVYYPPLAEVQDAVPAFALADTFHGQGLGGTWSAPGKRSAFVGTFAR
jgi:hypothetical protein